LRLDASLLGDKQRAFFYLFINAPKVFSDHSETDELNAAEEEGEGDEGGESSERIFEPKDAFHRKIEGEEKSGKTDNDSGEEKGSKG